MAKRPEPVCSLNTHGVLQVGKVPLRCTRIDVAVGCMALARGLELWVCRMVGHDGRLGSRGVVNSEHELATERLFKEVGRQGRCCHVLTVQKALDDASHREGCMDSVLGAKLNTRIDGLDEPVDKGIGAFEVASQCCLDHSQILVLAFRALDGTISPLSLFGLLAG